MENSRKKEIITDILKLEDRCDEIDVRKENSLMREIILDLKETCRENKNCVGLAANQIGYDKRIFIINFNGNMRTFINPIITETKGLSFSRESCLSLPGKEYIRPRNNDIKVTYQTPLGKIESSRFIGLAAYVFQHELDHLDGLLLSDIGLEIDKDFDKASEEDKEKILHMYMESLDLKEKELNKEIESNEDLNNVDKGIKFMEALQRGEITLEPIENKEENKE